jgi:hypothetical protein
MALSLKFFPSYCTSFGVYQGIAVVYDTEDRIYVLTLLSRLLYPELPYKRDIISYIVSF